LSQAQLTFDCTCASNNSAPGLQYYTQTLPTFICQQLYANCIQTNAGNADGQDECKSNIQKLCATQNPPSIAEISKEADASTAASTTAPTSAATHDATTTSAEKTASSSASSTSSKALAAATMGPSGAGVFAMAAAGLAAYAL
jgi:predicted exporter